MLADRQRFGITSAMSASEAAAPQKSNASRAWLRALEATANIGTAPTRTLPVVMQEGAQTFGDAPALISECECWSHRELSARMNRYARFALAHGIAHGDAVALMMPNRPEYLAIWLGISAVGGVVALLNTNLSGRALAHCINVVAPRHIIVAAELHEAFASARGALECAPTIWMHGAGCWQIARIDQAVDTCSDAPLESGEGPRVTLDDRALYMYTSGTTGWPKAAIIDHRRLMNWSHWFAGMIGTTPADRMYDCLPLYHSVGGVVATGAVLVNGGSVVIREKFSASRFWDDVAHTECTLFQYIGELCRYLVNAPPHPHERAHRLRLCCGNGLSAGVWNTFQNRFAIPQILEFYAATEGNLSLYNAEGKPGAIGRVPPFLAHRFPVALVKIDAETGEPARGAHGFCMRCAPDEIGHALGRIGKGASGAGGRFEGYTSAAETEKKVLRNVFEPGDAWFATGDLMRRDAQGYFYFVDRIGDTFRWKGENVATSEVAEALSEFPAIADASVYGVSIPGMEGRVGMAALVPNGPMDLVALRAHLAARLPAYARPLFLRIRSRLDVTATFKHTKSDLVTEGYDPNRADDPLYFDHPARQAFVPLTPALYDEISTGRIAL
jgi:fatty-acyl-CoA synthase